MTICHYMKYKKRIICDINSKISIVNTSEQIILKAYLILFFCLRVSIVNKIYIFIVFYEYITILFLLKWCFYADKINIIYHYVYKR